MTLLGYGMVKGWLVINQDLDLSDVNFLFIGFKIFLYYFLSLFLDTELQFIWQPVLLFTGLMRC